jgi:Rps23 Pro-64 3,4-dihydroxylase Tpa1-like proline 4-hydroxylase
MFHKLIEEFLSEDECNSIIDLGKSSDMKRMRSSKFKNGILVNSKIEYEGNKRLGCYFTSTEDFPILRSLTEKTINLINRLIPFNSIQYTDIQNFSFNKYSPGDFLDWHSDDHEILKGATLTCIYQLNQDYKGGEILILEGQKEIYIEKKRGSIFIFDPKIPHSIKSVDEGERYSINSWPSSVKIKGLI